MKNKITIFLGEDSIYTNATGIRQLLTFYYKCKQFNDVTIQIALDNIGWLDGNLCAVLGSLLYRLNKENGLSFLLDAKQVADKCNVLFYNNFLPVELTKGAKAKASCIPFRAFYVHQKDEFINYLSDELLVHPGMPKFSEETKDKLIDDLTEISGNIHKHAETNDPFFVCGQHYYKNGTVNFTVSDLGEGFFPKVKAAKPELIQTDGDAILWAVQGNSTKKDAPGGQGLKKLRQYFEANGGGMHIFTGANGWLSEQSESNLYKNGIVPLPNAYNGASINLIFNKKSLVL